MPVRPRERRDEGRAAREDAALIADHAGLQRLHRVVGDVDDDVVESGFPAPAGSKTTPLTVVGGWFCREQSICWHSRRTQGCPFASPLPDEVRVADVGADVRARSPASGGATKLRAARPSPQAATIVKPASGTKMVAPGIARTIAIPPRSPDSRALPRANGRRIPRGLSRSPCSNLPVGCGRGGSEDETDVGALQVLAVVGGAVGCGALAVPTVRFVTAPAHGAAGAGRWIKTVPLDSLPEGEPKRVALVADHRDAWTDGRGRSSSAPRGWSEAATP